MKIAKLLGVLSIFLIIPISFILGQQKNLKIIPGAERMPLITPVLKNKTIAVVANYASLVGDTHLVDTLLRRGAKIKKIFCPEHGFRGSVGAGEFVKNSRDTKTGIPIVSLYGKKVKPSVEDLKGVDVVIYDLQDVGVRFYTYISTLTYVMQACAENFIPLFILDRPNPNGFYIDGPVLDLKCKSFVGMHPVPIVYGMTPGEYANMVNEEGWLGTAEKCSIGVILCQNYSHKMKYVLPINPSPNLQNMKAVYLYPSLALFEGTIINVGRGTDVPFQVFGHPDLKGCTFTYTPRSIANAAKIPPHMGKLCYGVDLSGLTEDSLTESGKINLDYLMFAYKNSPNKKTFFTPYFQNLAGNRNLKQQIIDSVPVDDIRKGWQAGIDTFKVIRKKHLLYEDFE